MEHPWLFDRCREVQAEPNGYLDLWSREHYKSTIITYGKTIQDILASHGDDPLPAWGAEATFGIFSHSRPIAKDFLAQIKFEFETNRLLKEWFPDIIWQDPKRHSPGWSEDGGIIVKRATNPKEATVEAWGLVDGQPTGKHFLVQVYDDVVTLESVRSSGMMKKTLEAWEHSLNLGAKGGYQRYIGTRYHFNDAYKDIMKREAAVPRLYPGTEDGSPEGDPVLWDPKTMADKRRHMGSYTFACHAAGTRVLMADWTWKPIESIQAGESVVGYEQKHGQRTRLVATPVVATNCREAETNRYLLESGSQVVCTPDHNWWHGRWRETKSYSPLGFGYGQIDGLCRVVETVSDEPPDHRAAAYLAGIYDGEGSVSNGVVHIAQSERHHPEVCEAIREALQALGFPWSEHRPRPGHVDFYLTDGRAAISRFLFWCRPRKSAAIINALLRQPRGGGCKNGRDLLINIESAGVQPVYNIQTGTGNYIAEGYASKNCQILQNPVADDVQGFVEENLRFYEHVSREGMNVYILVDPASEKKKLSDYTVFMVVGFNDDENIYILDIVRDRLNLTERTETLFALHRKWRPMRNGVGYEKYGMQSDIEHIEAEQERRSYRFPITPLAGPLAKEDRIRRLVPHFEAQRIYLPEKLIKKDYQGVPRDLVRDFIDEELVPFPVGEHDDMLDALARIEDPDMNTEFPKPDEALIDDDDDHEYTGESGWMGA